MLVQTTLLYIYTRNIFQYKLFNFILFFVNVKWVSNQRDMRNTCEFIIIYHLNFINLVILFILCKSAELSKNNFSSLTLTPIESIVDFETTESAFELFYDPKHWWLIQKNQLKIKLFLGWLTKVKTEKINLLS
jgi:hypothetical protein